MVIAICGKSMGVLEITLETGRIQKVLLVLFQELSEITFLCPPAPNAFLEEGQWDHGCPMGTASTLAMPWWLPGGADFIIWSLRRGEGTSTLTVSINFWDKNWARTSFWSSGWKIANFLFCFSCRREISTGIILVEVVTSYIAHTLAYFQPPLLG